MTTRGELIEAANILHEVVGGATSGPWSVGMDPETGDRSVVYSEFIATRYPSVDPAVARVVPRQYPEGEAPAEWGQTSDARLISVFSPDVADLFALALDEHAQVHKDGECEWEDPCSLLRIARIINGGAA